MDETILFPSPNWFQLSGVAISPNGWIAYGGPSKSLCLLEPIPSEYNAVIKGKPGYKAHVVKGAHPEKVVSVDISPEWPTKKLILTGSSDGLVKQWNVAKENEGLKIKCSHTHDVHRTNGEDVVGVGYTNQEYAITVGGDGNVVRWHLDSNMVKNYSNLIKKLKPTCMVCSPHLVFNVAVGTKQGVIFVLDLTDHGKVLYKVRAHDDELLYLSWCPQFEVLVKKELKTTSFAMARMERIRNEPEPSEASSNLKTEVGKFPNKPSASKDEDDVDSENEIVVEEDDMFDIYKDHESDEFGHKKYQPENIYVKAAKEKKEIKDFLAECLKLKQEIINRKNEPEPSIESLVEALDKTHVDAKEKTDTDNEISVANKDSGDFENKTSVEDEKSKEVENTKTSENNGSGDKNREREKTKETNSVSSKHIHRHLLATIGKLGGVRIWSKSGKQVAQCSVHTSANTNTKHKQVPKPGNLFSILWYKRDVLLMTDGKAQLLMCNPLETDAKHKFEWTVVHSLHKRGLFSIVSTAPRVQTAETPIYDWPVFTSAQDRALIEYSLKEKKVVKAHGTCGGFLYSVAPCPYDARKIAACVGDGAVRVWECDTLENDERGLTPGHVTTYWQNVQGKVLTIAWHPTRENVLAFATAESRVGIIDTSTRHEKPAKVLQPTLNGGVYALSWGERGHLYASGGGELVMYNVDKPNQAPQPVQVSLEGKQWKLNEVKWGERALLAGSLEGAVAVMTSQYPHTILAAAFPFTKMIHCIEWHPQQVSSSSEESAHKNLIAVCSNDKVSTIAILQIGEAEDGNIKLSTVRMLAGHCRPVLRVAWSPHREELLVSTCADSTVRVWDALEGVCTAIFSGHAQATLGVCWSGLPSLSDVLLSGGADCALRMWKIEDYPAQAYVERKPESTRSRRSKLKEKVQTDKQLPAPAKDIDSEFEEETVTKDLVVSANNKKKKGSKTFLFPIMRKQIDYNSTKACRLLLKKYLEKNGSDKSVSMTNVVTNGSGNHVEDTAINGDKLEPNNDRAESNSKKIENVSEKLEAVGEKLEAVGEKLEADAETEETNVEKIEENGCDFIKMFGSINEVNELLDMELNGHLSTSSYESWMCVGILRGHIDKVFQFASQRDLVSPFLLSMAPCVSAKFWKDATLMYLAQMDRLVMKGEAYKLYECSTFGGPGYYKAWSLLTLHDVRAAVSALTDAALYKEAYLLCRVRYMDSIAEETLRMWANASRYSAKFAESALCYIVLGDLSQAAYVLSKSKEEEHLNLAAEIAKLTGEKTYATHIEEKTEQIKLNKATEEALETLPSRLELLMREHAKKEGNVEESSQTVQS